MDVYDLAERIEEAYQKMEEELERYRRQKAKEWEEWKKSIRSRRKVPSPPKPHIYVKIDPSELVPYIQRWLHDCGKPR